MFWRKQIITTYASSFRNLKMLLLVLPILIFGSTTEAQATCYCIDADLVCESTQEYLMLEPTMCETIIFAGPRVLRGYVVMVAVSKL